MEQEYNITKQVLTKIAELREQKGWSIYQLALKSGLATKTIYKWYNEESTPTITALEAVAQTLGISLCELFITGEEIIADEEVKEIISLWKKLPEPKKKLVLEIIKSYI